MAEGHAFYDCTSESAQILLQRHPDAMRLGPEDGRPSLRRQCESTPRHHLQKTPGQSTTHGGYELRERPQQYALVEGATQSLEVEDNNESWSSVTPSQQLPSPPSSVGSRKMAVQQRSLATGNWATGDTLEKATLRCCSCGTEIVSLEFNHSGLESTYCCQCSLKQERLLRARQSHLAVARRAQAPHTSPVSDDTRLSMHFARTIEAIGSQHSWITLGPSRVGTHRAFDAAAQALYHGAMFRAQKDSGRVSQFARNSAVLSYTRAAKQLQKNIDSASDRLSDEVLATVTMFYTFEILVPSPQMERTNFHHLSAIKTILLNRSNSGPPTELTRALVYTVFGWLFYTIAAQGFTGPSPFETDYYLNMEPFTLDSPPASLTKLRKLTLQLYIKLPRLITDVLNLRNRNESDVRKVVQVATGLLHLEDRTAENTTVRLLTVHRTREDTGIRDVLPYSYDFHSLHWQAVVNYWQCRLMVIRLCLTTSSLAADGYDLQWLARNQEALLVREQDRIMESVLMSWQYASDLGFTGRAQMIASLNEVWGALAARDKTSRGVSAAKLRTFILEQRRRLGLGSMGERGAAAMDAALNTFGGFPNSASTRQPAVVREEAYIVNEKSAVPTSEVLQVKDEEVESEPVELDWFGFGKNDLK